MIAICARRCQTSVAGSAAAAKGSAKGTSKLPCCMRERRAQGSAALGFEFAARRWVDDGTPITAGLLKEDSVYWIASLGSAQ